MIPINWPSQSQKGSQSRKGRSHFRRVGLLAIGGGTRPAITGNSVTDYGFAGNPIAIYDFASMWDADYGIVGIPVAGKQLPAFRAPSTVDILIIRTYVAYFLNISTYIVYFGENDIVEPSYRYDKFSIMLQS
jgi:hypothetical protein